MRRPALQRASHLIQILRLIVYPGHASPMPRLMIEYGLDDMRLNSVLGHACRNAPADIVDAPTIRQPRTGFGPITKSPPEYVIGLPLREEPNRRVGQWEDVLSMVFRPRCGDGPKLP